MKWISNKHKQKYLYRWQNMQSVSISFQWFDMIDYFHGLVHLELKYITFLIFRYIYLKSTSKTDAELAATFLLNTYYKYVFVLPFNTKT